MKKTSLALCAAIALPVSLPSLAGTPNPSDPVAASFARMLTEPARTAAPDSPTQLEDDPLYRQLTAVLWQIQPTVCALNTPGHELPGQPLALR